MIKVDGYRAISQTFHEAKISKSLVICSFWAPDYFGVGGSVILGTAVLKQKGA